MRWKWLIVAAAVVALGGLAFLIGAGPLGSAHDGVVPPPNDGLEAGDTRHEELAAADPSQWLTTYDPAACDNGYTLILFQRRIPVLIDMNARVVHAWPKVRAVGRVRLNPNGVLAVKGVDGYLKEYAWNGRLLWYFRAPDEKDLFHHDFARLANGDYLLLMRNEHDRLDYLLEVDHHKRVVWTWRIADHLGVDLPHADLDSHDPTHCNSVQEIPPNPRFAAGDERFRPGNILVSARNLNCIFVVDRRTGKVVWHYEDGLDYQHEARMIATGNVGAGLIVVFDNGYNNLRAYRRSSVLAIDPDLMKPVWTYSTEGFFCSVAGTAEPLPNGNALVTTSQGGRIFEITEQGRIVWQLVPPFLPMRALRYPADYCPQLARLDPQEEQPVQAEDARPFIDQELYAYTLPEEHQVAKDFHGRERRLVKEPSSCRVLWLPARPHVVIGYGFDPVQLGRAQVKAHFRATIEPLQGGSLKVLVDDEMSSSDSSLWREPTIRLDDLGRQKVRLCLDAQWQGDVGQRRGERIVRWQSPYIRGDAAPSPPRDLKLERERRLRERQLKTIGYLQ